MSFRVGTTSFVIPDAIIPNLRYLSGKVQDVELLSFESDEISPLPTASEIKEMSSIGRNFDLSYTVHLPVDIDLGADSILDRNKSVEKLKRTIDRFSPVDPIAWNLHLNRPSSEGWDERVTTSIKSLLSVVCGDRLCVENTDFDYQTYLPIVDELGVSICLDVGHLLAGGKSYGELIDRAKVIHLHGVDESGKDHRDLGHLYKSTIKDIVTNFKGEVLTIEVFSEEKFTTSLSILKEYL